MEEGISAKMRPSKRMLVNNMLEGKSSTNIANYCRTKKRAMMEIFANKKRVNIENSVFTLEKLTHK